MYYIFIIDKMPSRADFDPRAVVWRPLVLGNNFETKTDTSKEKS